VKSINKSSSIQRWLFALLVAGFLWVLFNRIAEIRQLLGTLIQGQWAWIALAAGLQVCFYLIYAALFQAAFRLVDIPARVRDLLPITFASMFVNATTPTAGAAGMALFIDDARRREHSAAAATAGTLLVQASVFGVFIFFLSAGLAYLFHYHNLTALEFISAMIMFVLAGVLFGVLILALWRPDWLRSFFAGMARLVNGVGSWVKRPFILSDQWAEKNARDFSGAASAIRAHPPQLAVTLLIALAMHLTSVASLYCLFQAFHQTPTPVILVVGYAMSFLFMIVSPTPSGIGVVEVIVPLVYSSMGVPAAAGTAVTLSFRGLSFWLPMLLGFFLLRQLSMFSSSERALAESGQVRFVAILTALMGILNVLSVFQPELFARVAVLAQYSPVAVRQNGAITAIFAGFSLLILAYGLWRHKRMAWMLTLFVLLLSIVGHVLKQNYAEAVLAGLLAFYLVAQRSHFHALSDRPSVWQGVQVLVAAFAFTLAYGTIGFYVLDQIYGQPFNLIEVWQQTFLFFTTSSDPGLFTLTTPYDYLTASIYIVGVMTFGIALFLLLRPVLVRAPASERERQRAETIVRQHGHSSLAHLVAQPDKSFFFSEGGSVVGFALYRRTAIVLGDPIGPANDAVDTIFQFRDYCQRHDWRDAFYRTGPAYLEAYQQAGMQTLCIGEETAVIIQADALAEDALETGWQTAVYQPPFPRELVERLRLVSDAWLSSQHREESRFAHGWFSRSYLNQGVLTTLSKQGRDILAFAHAVPTSVNGELALSMLRYRDSVTSDTRDYLIKTLVQWASTQNYARLSLGLQALPEDRRSDNPALERTAQGIYNAMEPAMWETSLSPLTEILPMETTPCYLVYPGAASLPVVWSALARTGGSNAWLQIKLSGNRT
jgi:phosphatidylglycerol lysyltransferase